MMHHTSKKYTILLLFSLSLILFCTAQKREIYFIKELSKDTLYLHLANNLFAPVSVEFSKVDSLSPHIKTLEKTLLNARDTLKGAMRISRLIVSDTNGLKYSDFAVIKASLGNPEQLPDKNFLYTLPFQKGKSYRVMQPFFGSFSHNQKHSKFALDFDMSIGEKVCAARSGRVVRIRDWFKERGGREFTNKANTITIMHNDGSFGHYDHLDFKGVLVKLGEFVKKGQVIGKSGFTGFTTKPHLHFVVIDPEGASIPIYFEGYKKKNLKKGKYYKRKK